VCLCVSGTEGTYKYTPIIIIIVTVCAKFADLAELIAQNKTTAK